MTDRSWYFPIGDRLIRTPQDELIMAFLCLQLFKSLPYTRSSGDPFLLCDDHDADEQKEAEEEGGGVGSWYACYDDAFSMWKPHAWKTAATCLTSSFALFMTLVVEDLSATKTYVLVAVIVFLVTGACASACVAFKRDRAEQQLDVGVELGHIA